MHAHPSPWRRGLAALSLLALVAWSPLDGPTERSRRVAFTVVPAGARVVVDAQAVQWFATDVELAPGAHAVMVDMPRSPCCRPWSGIVQVTPVVAGAPGADAQRVHVRLEPLPAIVDGGELPEGAHLECSSLGFAVDAGRAAVVTLPEVVWSGRCNLSVPGAGTRALPLELRAGEVNRVAGP